MEENMRHDKHHEHKSEHGGHKTEHHHKTEHKSHSGGSTTSKKNDNWKIYTAVLGVLLIISVFTNGFDFSNGSGVSESDASSKAMKFINENLLQGQANAELVSMTEEAGMYNLELSVSGQKFNSYLSKDAKLFFPQVINLDEPLPTAQDGAPAQAAPPVNVVKSDKPKVEMFVMSHCPYGTQAQKGILPVVDKLGDKIDFELKYVYYAMHGQTELDEQMKQVCIKNEQPQRFYTYLACFLEDGDTERCLAANNVEMDKLNSCVDTLEEEYGILTAYEDQSTWLSGRYPLFDVDKADNEKYQVGGSPTLVINGAQASSDRSPAGFLSTICGAFNEAPEECGAQLSAASFSPGFGYDTAAAGVQASCAP